MQTKATSLLGIRLPIVQGGLAHLAYAELAAAVSEAGGLGQLTATSMADAQELREEIARMREMTDKPFAVNYAIGRTPLEQLIQVAVDEKVPILSLTGRDPSPYLKMLEGVPVKKMVMVSTRRQAVRAEELGADILVAVGFEGGGHIGRDEVGNMVLVPVIAQSVSIPVLACGGITDGRGLIAALALGAEGVVMGTRFIATQECRAHPNYKQSLLQALETDTRLIEKSLGRPGRVLDGPITQHILELEAQGAGMEDILPMILAEMNVNAAIGGDMENGFVWAGQSVGLIQDIPTVQDLLEKIMAQAQEIQKRLSTLTD